MCEQNVVLSRATQGWLIYVAFCGVNKHSEAGVDVERVGEGVLCCKRCGCERGPAGGAPRAAAALVGVRGVVLGERCANLHGRPKKGPGVRGRGRRGSGRGGCGWLVPPPTYSDMVEGRGVRGGVGSQGRVQWPRRVAPVVPCGFLIDWWNLLSASEKFAAQREAVVLSPRARTRQVVGKPWWMRAHQQRRFWRLSKLRRSRSIARYNRPLRKSVQ